MADEADNPFASFGPQATGPGTASVAQAPANDDDVDNPFAEFGPKAVAPADSTTGAFVRGAERGALPAAGGLVGAGAGAEVGGAIGAFGGPVGALVGGFVGGVAGAFGGSYAADKAQDYALSKAPDSWTEAIGQDDRQQKLDQEQHPYASFLGGLAPYALTMNPAGATGKVAANATALQRLMANPVTARIFGGAAMGGVELGQEAASGEPVDWGKVAISTGFGIVFNRPNRLGETIEGLGARPFRGAEPLGEAVPPAARAPAPEIEPQEATIPQPDLAGFEGLHTALTERIADEPPTLAEAGDLGIMGPGLTEDTFMGAHEQDPTAKAAAQDLRRTEQQFFGTQEPPDLDLVARRLDPDTFAVRDMLITQRDILRTEYERAANPPEPRTTDNPEVGATSAQLQEAHETLRDLNAQRDALRGQMNNLAEAGPVESLSALGAQMQDIDAKIRETTIQRNKLRGEMINLSAPGPEPRPIPNEQLLAVSAHLQAVEQRLRENGLDVAAARRRAADRLGSETVAPEPIPVRINSPENSPISQIAETTGETPANIISTNSDNSRQTRPFSIEDDVHSKLLAAGRPADEAAASAKLTQALYETHAARVGGDANEIYQREAPDIRAGKGTKARGKLTVSDGRGVLKLMREANASTYAHEIGHDWLERILRDAEDPKATDSLKSDAAAIRQQIGAKAGEAIPTKAHEKFARAFEQYLREGVAPSAKLARVFAQFRNWLLDVYQTIKGLGAPINEDIRGVFDRMLSTEPQRTVISSERPGGPSLTDIHKVDAALTEPQDAGNIAERVRAERLRAEQEPQPEVENEIAKAVAEDHAELEAERAAAGGTDAGGEDGAGAERLREVEPDRGEAGAQSGGGELGAGSRAVGSGGNAATAESSSVRQPGADRSGGPKSQPLAPTPARILDPVADRLVDRAGNIRVENLTNVREIAEAIHDSAERNDDFRTVRGKMTAGQMSDLAAEMGLDASKLSETALARLLGGTNDLAPRILAARRLLVDSAEIVSNAMAKAADSNDPQTMADFAESVMRHDMIQSALAGVTAEWGRAGTAFRTLTEGWDKAQPINDFLKENTGRTLYQLKAMAKLGKQLDSDYKISKFLRDTSKRSAGRMLLEYWINGLISGIATHTTYVIGNQILSALKIGPETLAAALIGGVHERFGREGERVYVGEVGQNVAEYFRSLPKATQAVIEAFRTGQTTLLPGEKARPLLPFSGEQLPTRLRIAQTIMNSDVRWSEAQGDAFSLFRGMKDGLVATGKLLAAGGEAGAPLVGFNYSPLGQIPDLAYRGVTVLPVGQAARLPSRAIAAIHSFFRASGYSIENNAKAFRQAKAEGRAGTDFDARVAQLRQDPSAESMTASTGIANDLTLMGNGSEFVRKISAVTNHAYNLPFLGETQLLKFIDPFVHIAANIIDQSIVQRTPVGLLSPELRADLLGKNGNVAQDTASAKMLVGSALALTFGGLAAEGVMSGSGPSDPAKAAMWRLAGNQAHSVRIGDMWYDVHRLGPLGMLAGIAADMYDVAHVMAKGDLLQAGAMLQHAFTQNILDESFMRGPSELIQAIDEPDRYGERYIQNLLSSFVPYSVGLSQIDRATDPYSRQARTVMDAIKQKIPGESETLFPRRDVWGEPMANHDALVAKGLTAIYEQQMSRDPVNRALVQLGMGPHPVPRSILNVKLNDQQYDDFARLAGRMTKMRLDAIVRSPDWNTWDPTTKRNAVEAVVKMNRQAARGLIQAKYPSIPAQAALNKRNKNNAPLEEDE